LLELPDTGCVDVLHYGKRNDTAILIPVQRSTILHLWEKTCVRKVQWRNHSLHLWFQYFRGFTSGARRGSNFDFPLTLLVIVTTVLTLQQNISVTVPDRKRVSKATCRNRIMRVKVSHEQWRHVTLTSWLRYFCVLISWNLLQKECRLQWSTYKKSYIENRMIISLMAPREWQVKVVARLIWGLISLQQKEAQKWDRYMERIPVFRMISANGHRLLQ